MKLEHTPRRVSLVRGEALFTVTHDASRPFEIEMGPGRVVDLGTRFDVEKLPGAVRVAVFEGRVGVKTPHGEVVLGAGRRGGYDDHGNLLTTDQAAMVTEPRADGSRHFESETLAVVLARMSRYHRVTFVFSDPQLQQLRVSGTFRLTDLNLFLSTLSAVLPVDVCVGADRSDVEIVPRTPVNGPGVARCAGRGRSRKSTTCLLLTGLLQGMVLAVAAPTAFAGVSVTEETLYSRRHPSPDP